MIDLKPNNGFVIGEIACGHEGKLDRLLKLIDDFFKNKKIEYSIIIVPQYYDLKFKESCKKYINFFKELDNPNIQDVTEEILNRKNWKKYYFVDKYGGHLNKQGNNLLANLLYKKNL